jgi:hypothetical protein
MHDATAIDPATTPEASGKRTAHLAPALRLLCGLVLRSLNSVGEDATPVAR